MREHQAQRRDVRAQRVVGRQRLGHALGLLRRDARIDHAAPVAPGPAVEGALFHRGEVVGHEVAADLVALVHHGPQHVRLGLPAQAVGVAQAAGEQALLAALRIDLPDRGAALFGRHAVLADVAVGADRDVQLAAVGAGDDVLGPVVVEAGGQRRHHGGRGADRGLALGVGHLHERVGVGDEELVADQRHAVGRCQVRQEHLLHLGQAVAVGVAQQGDAVGAGHAGARAAHDLAHDPVAHRGDRAAGAAAFGFGRLVALGHQHVAVGQGVDPARVVQPARQRRHAQAFGGGGRGGVGPADGGRHVDGGDQRLVRIGQLRPGAGRELGRELGGLAAAGDEQHGGHGRCRKSEADGKVQRCVHADSLRGRRPQTAGSCAIARRGRVGRGRFPACAHLLRASSLPSPHDRRPVPRRRLPAHL
ncbi:hypothetical protein D3C71_830110 [compost metagenome]